MPKIQENYNESVLSLALDLTSYFGTNEKLSWQAYKRQINWELTLGFTLMGVTIMGQAFDNGQKSSGYCTWLASLVCSGGGAEEVVGRHSQQPDICLLTKTFGHS